MDGIKKTAETVVDPPRMERGRANEGDPTVPPGPRAAGRAYGVERREHSPRRHRGERAAVQTASNPKCCWETRSSTWSERPPPIWGHFKGLSGLYTIGPNGGPLSGTGVLIGSHKYISSSSFSPVVSSPRLPATTTQVDFTFNVTGGTKKYAFASGSGQITGNQTLQTLRFSFRIAGLVNRPH